MSTTTMPLAPSEARENLFRKDRQYGPMLEGSWVPAPRYVLRRERILAALAARAPGRVLEVGCGAGALLRELADLGHECTGLEAAPAAASVARTMNNGANRTQIVSDPSSDWNEGFDILLAFEVLEHIEQDAQALREWLAWLKPGGLIILSMPAHMRSWSKRDEWAGHVRRYEREDILRLAAEAKVQIELIECYGYPLATFTNWLANKRFRNKEKAGGAADPLAATAASGTDRSVDLAYFGMQQNWLGRFAMTLACWTQRLFLKTDLGDGYIIVASKS
ncbi:class I SAM-dependent methyltransferase [Novosphingobium jiangmenense]